MAWCPVCKNEYVEGITKCADCGAELVDRLPEEEGNVAEAEENIFYPQEYQEGRSAYINNTALYEDSGQKAADFKNSACVLLAVGIAGLAGLAGMCFQLFPLEAIGLSKLSTAFQPLSLGTLVMGALFMLFIVMGVSSLRSAKTYRGRAVEEKRLREEITDWCRDNLSKQEEDDHDSQWISQEELYFKRMEQMKKTVLDRYPDSGEGLVESILDELYPEIYGE